MFGIKVLAGILGISMILNGAAGFAHKTLLQQGIAEEVLRFHVLANSDSEEDQEIKMKVRDAVLEWAEKILEYKELIENEGTDWHTGKNTNEKMKSDAKETATDDSTADNRNWSAKTMTKNEVTNFLKEHLGEIKELAEKVLQEYGYDYEASANIQSCYFPDRTYRDCTFPAGWYDALRIELGEAKGRNWWCVFYPQLCFADYLHVISDNESTDLKQNERLEQMLTVEEYELLLQNPKKWKIGFRWF